MIYDLTKMDTEEMHYVDLACSRSYIQFNKTKKTAHITKTLLELTGGRWKEAVEWWVSNVYYSLTQGAIGIKFSLRKDVYAKHPQKLGYRKMKSFVDFLEGEGYIDLYKGGVLSWTTEQGKLCPDKVISSAMVYTKKTTNLFCSSPLDMETNLWKEFESRESVVIRDSKTKLPMPTKGRQGISTIRKGVEMVNTSMVGANIKYQDKPIAGVQYQRIFSDSLEKGGRLYVAGGGVQQLPQHLRLSHLTIDNEPVVEVDFVSLHCSILSQLHYNDTGFNIKDITGEDHDHYDADLSFITLDEEAISEWETKYGERLNPLRALAKDAMMIALNAGDVREASWALSSKVISDRSKGKSMVNGETREHERKYVGLPEKIDYPRVLEAVTYHNDHIKEHLFKGYWGALQKLDSEIMMHTLTTMNERGHTVLSYHDSCIVKESAVEDLKEAMTNAWMEVLGDTTFCRMKVSS